MRNSNKHTYTTGEEIANSITHGLGVALSLIAAVLLLKIAIAQGELRQLVAATIFGSSMLMLYSTSTFYHSLRKPEAKYIFKVLDHSSIYLLIAGTYTPFALIILKGLWGWGMLSLVWAIAIAGIAIETQTTYKPKFVSAAIYLLMGWLALIAIKPLIAGLPYAGIKWLVAGGLFYTGGVLFYLSKKIRYMHAVWHIFVLAGSGCHFIAILFYVLPAR